MGRDGVVAVVRLADSLFEILEISCLEGPFEGAELIQHAAQAPAVTLVRVRLGGEDLRTHVVWGPHLPTEAWSPTDHGYTEG